MKANKELWGCKQSKSLKLLIRKAIICVSEFHEIRHFWNQEPQIISWNVRQFLETATSIQKHETEKYTWSKFVFLEISTVIEYNIVKKVK